MTKSYRLYASFSAIAGALAFYLIFPYYLIPSDDRSFLLDPNPTSPRPVFMILLWLAKGICGMVNWPETQAWSILLVFSFALSGFLLMGLAEKISEKRSLALLTGLLFFTNSWTGAYFFWGNYAPITTVFCLASIWVAWDQTPLSRLKQLVIGALLGAYFWCSPSGLVWIIVFSIWFFIHRKQKGIPAIWLASFLAILVGVPSSGMKILNHWKDNLNGARFDAFQRDFGFPASIPLGSYWRVAWVEQELLTLICIFALLFGFTFLSKKEKKRNRVYLALLALCLSHALIIEFLPFTKLGRTHYPVLPFSILFSVAILGMLPESFSGTVKRYLKVVVGAFLILTCFEGVCRSYEIGYAKQAAWNYAKETQELYFLASDLHAWHWQETLKEGKIPYRVLHHPAELPPNGVLLIGPHGPGSGRTALQAAWANDWHLSDSDLRNAGLDPVASFPSYAYLPSFAMESEFAQALYFRSDPSSLSARLLPTSFWKRAVR